MMNTDFIFRETGIDSCFDEIYSVLHDKFLNLNLLLFWSQIISNYFLNSNFRRDNCLSDYDIFLYY